MSEESKGENSQNEPETQEDREVFERKKTNFFSKIALNTKNAFRAHKEAGLLGRDEKLDKSWKNVSEHCLVEIARAEVFADKLGLPEDLKKDLAIAAALHDTYKRQEAKIFDTMGMTWNAIVEAEKREVEFLTSKGFNNRIVKMVRLNSFDPSGIKEVSEKENLSPEDIACIVLYYIDAYTHGSEWAEPSKTGEGGEVVNAVDWRSDSVKLRYKESGEDSKKYFNGEPVFDIQLKVKHFIEKRIADILNQKNNGSIIPEDLPYLIDQEIRDIIEAQN